MRGPGLTISLRPFPGLVIAHATIPSLLGFTVLLAVFSETQRIYALAGVGFLVVGAGYALQAARQHLHIENGVVSYTDFFGRPRELRLEEIRGVHYEAASARWADRYAAFPRLRVTTVRRDTKRPIYIDLTAYRRAHERELLRLFADAGLLRDLQMPKAPTGIVGDE